ncbi:hypothetical protein V8D89_014321 [Ganoderma adspersum]
MAAPRLNLDILMVVCTFLGDVSDVHSFSWTCSSLYRIATRWLLRTRVIYLMEHMKVKRFHSFLFADAPTRSPHVRKLSVSVRSQIPRMPMEPRFNQFPLIIDILASCPRVESISLVLDNESPGCRDNMSIADAIAGMQSLRSFSIKGLPNDVISLLRKVRFPLRRLDINDNPRVTREGSFWTPVALAQFLPRLAPTLENLGIDKFNVDPEDILATQNIMMPPVFTMAQHAAVRSLTVGSFHGKPLLSHVQHLFPALDGTLTIRQLDTLTPEDTYTDIRTTNQRAQEGDRPADGSCSASHTWTKLGCVVCSVQILYILGLRCPIRLVRFDRCSSDALHYAADALRENPVPHLALSLLLGGELHGLDALLSPELAGSLTHLTLELVYTRTDPSARTVARFPFNHFLAKMTSAFRTLQKLTHLRIVILSHVTYRSYVTMMQSDEFMRTVHGRSFDFNGTAAGLLSESALPNLRYLFVETSGSFETTDMPRRFLPGEREHTSWRLARGWRAPVPTEHPTPLEGPGAATPDLEELGLVELSEEVRETLIRNEELLPWDDRAARFSF